MAYQLVNGRLVSTAARAGAGAPAAQQSAPDEQSLMGSVANAGLSGLGAVGNFIDVPGSMFRDTIGLLSTGDWDKYNPFDQLLTPTTSENRNYGRDMLSDAGILNPNKETGMSGWLDDPMEGVRDMVGFGFDVLTDPLSWMTGPARSLTVGGELAKQSGVMGRLGKVAGKGVGPRVGRMRHTLGDLMEGASTAERAGVEQLAAKQGVNLADHLNQPLGGAMGFGMPLSNNASIVFGKAGGIGETLAGGMDAAGRAMRYGKIPGTQVSPGQHVARMFSPKAGGLHTPEVSPYAERGEYARELIHQGVRAETAKKFTTLFKKGAIDDESAMLGRMHAEGVLDMERLAKEAPEAAEKAAVYGEVLESFTKRGGITDEAQTLLDQLDGKAIASQIDTNPNHVTPQVERILKKNGIDVGKSSKAATGESAPSIVRAATGEIESFGGIPVVKAGPIGSSTGMGSGYNPGKQQIEIGPTHINASEGNILEFLHHEHRHHEFEALLTDEQRNLWHNLGADPGVQDFMIKEYGIKVSGNGLGGDEIRAFGLNPSRVGKQAVQVDPDSIPDIIAVTHHQEQQLGRNASNVDDLIGELRNKVADDSFPGLFDQATSFGRKINDFADPAGIDYFPREFVEVITNKANQLPREQYLRGLRKGTEEFRKVISDPKMYEGSVEDAVAYFKATYGKELESVFPVNPLGRTKDHAGNAGAAKATGSAQGSPSVSKVIIDSQEQIAEHTEALSEAGRQFRHGEIDGATFAHQKQIIESQLDDLRRKIDSGHRSSEALGRSTTVTQSNPRGTSRPANAAADLERIRSGQAASATKAEAHSQAALAREQQIQELVHQIQTKYTPSQRASGGFGGNPLLDAQNAKIGMQIGIAKSASFIEALSEHATPIMQYDRALGQSISVGEAIGKAGMEEITEQGGALFKFGEAVGEKIGIDHRTTAGQQQLRAMRVPERIADDIVRLVKGDDIKSVAGPMSSLYDQATNIFKVGVLSWPARIVRDFTSSQAMNVLTGNWSASASKGMHTLLAGGVADFTKIPVIRKMMQEQGMLATAENSTEMMRQLLYTHRLHSSSVGAQGVSEVAGDISGMGPSQAADISSEFAGRDPLSPFRPSTFNAGAKALSLEAINPLGIRGVGGRTQTTFKPAAIAERASRYTDSMGRGVSFVANLERGVDVTVAKRIANASQVNYLPESFTATERAYLKKAFPFYSFSSRMAKFVTKELVERPGGKLGQSIRGQNQTTQQDEPLPEHISQTASIPLGESEDGSQRFLSGLGLMHEVPMSYFGGGVRGALAQGASQLNPLAKAPIEWAAGESFFQRGPGGGRELSDMDPTVGRLLTNLGIQDETPSGKASPLLGSQGLEFLIGNSPLSRAASTARTLTDKRKYKGGPFPGSMAALNTLTGLRVTDVSQAARDAVLRETMDAEDRAMGARQFTQTYFSKADIEETRKTDPELAAHMERRNAFRRLKQKQAKARAKAKKEKK